MLNSSKLNFKRKVRQIMKMRDNISNTSTQNWKY